MREHGASVVFSGGAHRRFLLRVPPRHSCLSVHIIGTDAQTGVEIRLALGLALFWLVCIDGLGGENRSLGSLLRASPVRWVLVFLIVSGCSLLWGEAASPLASFAYWCGTACDVLIVLFAFRTGCPDEVGASLLRGFLWGSCCIAFITWIMPGQSDLRLGDEVLFNSNSVGNTCAFGIFFGQYLIRRKDGNCGVAILFLALTLVRSLSKTTIVAFAASEVFLVIQDRSMSRKTKTALTVATILVIFALWALFEAYYNLYTTTGNQAETVTGRTTIWAYVFEHALEDPWFGHGFDSMWGVTPLFGAFQARHAENEILEQFYSYGVAGVVILVGAYGSLYRAIRRRAASDVNIILTSILIFIVIRGFAEAEPFDLLLPLWAVVLTSMLTGCEDTLLATRSPVSNAAQLTLAPSLLRNKPEGLNSA